MPTTVTRPAARPGALGGVPERGVSGGEARARAVSARAVSAGAVPARTVTARAVSALAVSALAVAVLAGCSAGSQKKPVEDYAGEPKGVEAPRSSAGGASWAAWLPDADRFGIVLYGSSTCPPTVQSIAVTGMNAIKATLAPAPGGVCTHDFAPHTTIFDKPEGVSDGANVTVELPDTTLDLPARLG